MRCSAQKSLHEGGSGEVFRTFNHVQQNLMIGPAAAWSISCSYISLLPFLLNRNWHWRWSVLVMASSSHGELGALKSTKKQKKTKKKTRTQSKARSSESAEIEALEGNTEDQRVGLIENDESELFTNLCQGAAASNDACQYAECADANAKENLGTEPNHGCCSCFWDCLPTWLTKPNFYYTKNDDLDDFGVLKEIPKKRLLKIWEIFSAIDTDMDGQIDIAEVRRFFYHLGAASRDDRCRVRIAAEFDHPKGLPLVKGKDFLDALAEEPLETLKVSGWIRSFGSSFLSQISSGEASGSEDAGSTGSVQPISNTKDIDDEPDRRSLTGFWQFAASPLCQPTDSEDSIDLVNEFRAVASQQRWGRFRSWKFAKAIERFRQYNAACQTKRVSTKERVALARWNFLCCIPGPVRSWSQFRHFPHSCKP